MPYTIHAQPIDNYIKITVSGTMESARELSDFAGMLAEMGEQFGLSRVLLDESDLKKHLELLDIYQVAESDVTEKAAVRGVRMACIPNPENAKLMKGMETIMHNRSVSYKIFTDKDEATAWLTR